MKILQVLTYYRPHVSGLTIYVERLSKALVAQGHEVTVLTSQAEKDWPREEIRDGIRIVRVPVAFRISKGVIMPTLGLHAFKYVRWCDVLHLHLPQFDAPGFALRGKLMSKPTVLTYHCDLRLPDGLFNRFVDRIVLTMNRIAGSLADAVVTYTRDYGQNSPYLSAYVNRKLHIIPPPVELAACSDSEALAFYAKHGLSNQPIIGIATRLATEKGVEILLRALPIVQKVFPTVRVLHAGQHENVLGEEKYAERLAPMFAAQKEAYTLLGNLHGAELTAFYKNLDVLVLCSLNSTESFGLVQIEAMNNGVPCIASNLPGVRQSVTMSGMGEVVPIGDHKALADAIIRVLRDRASYVKSADTIAATFEPAQTAREYLKLYAALRDRTFDRSLPEPEPYQRLRAMRDQMKKAIHNP
ncbi:MAG: glycosyltransferase family 4 protein [Candidatus Promineifilaceae bacterium]